MFAGVSDQLLVARTERVEKGQLTVSGEDLVVPLDAEESRCSDARARSRAGSCSRLTTLIGLRSARISFFYGIGIWMYWNEGAHARPHFHARYADHVASIDLAGELIAGSLPRRAQALVAEWAALHREELTANWERARRGEQLEPIEPLS